MRSLKTITTIALLTFWTAALADCPPDKTEVTVVNAKGKVHVICIAASAVPLIGGTNDHVIAASCPCFAPETVQAALAASPGAFCKVYQSVGTSDPSCGGAECFDADWNSLFVAFTGTTDKYSQCMFAYDATSMWFTPMVPNICESKAGPVSTSVDQALACLAILRSLATP